MCRKSATTPPFLKEVSGLRKNDGFVIHDFLRAELKLFSFYNPVGGIVAGERTIFWPLWFFRSFFFDFCSNLSRTRRGFGHYPNFNILIISWKPYRWKNLSLYSLLVSWSYHKPRNILFLRICLSPFVDLCRWSKNLSRTRQLELTMHISY